MGGNIVIVPLRPLKPKTSYLVALTNHLEDNTGKPIYGSVSYELVQQDINSYPLGSEAQLGLQAVINSYESAVAGAGVEKSRLIYTAAITTQSTNDVLATLKALLAQNLANGVVPNISATDSSLSVAEVLTGKIPESAIPLYSLANYLTAVIKLPYYLGVPSSINPQAPVNTWWKSQCDSAAVLAGFVAGGGELPSDPASESDATCMAIAQSAGIPAPGLRDLPTLALDTERHLTKYSPVVQTSALSDMPHISDPSLLTVQVTTPDPSSPHATDKIKELNLPPLVEPENGWPVVILTHGITSKKEDMLALTGILSAFGFATVAIDLPLHGSRGFDLDNDGTDDINASTVSATHFMNLASLLTTRDNLRQSSADLLGLRLGLNFFSGNYSDDQAINIDATKIYFAGHSLGAITGINFLALANSPLSDEVDPLFKVAAASLAMPGTMAANFLIESASFGNVIKSQVTYKQSEEFQQYVATVHTGSQPPTQQELAGYYADFYLLLSPEQQVALNITFSQFVFATQTAIDAGDPVNYAQIMASTEIPSHLIAVVGNGTDNLPDQVIPNQVTTSPLGGTEGTISLLGLPSVSETSAGSGAVRFLNGRHETLLSAKDDEGFTSSPEINARATQEMQSQVASFLYSSGQQITVTDTELIK